jgi:hypothetical protein
LSEGVHVTVLQQSCSSHQGRYIIMFETHFKSTQKINKKYI